MITDADAERAWDYLSSSSKEYGRLQGLVAGLDDQRSIIRAQAFLQATGDTIAEREAQSKVNPDYKAICLKYADAVTEYHTIRAYRDAASAKLDCWRTLSASRRVNV